MTIQDDVIGCDCKGCLMYCRVPTIIYSTGDQGVMRNWAHDNVKGGDTGNGKLTLNWNVREVEDGHGNTLTSLDFCSNVCAMGNCGHVKPQSGPYANTRTEDDSAPAQSKFKNPFSGGRRKAPPKPPEPIVAKPIARMK